VAEHPKARELPRKKNIEEVEARQKSKKSTPFIVKTRAGASQSNEKYESYHEK